MNPPEQPEHVEFTQEQCLKLVTKSQYAILEHLAAVACRQKAEARYSKKRFQGGWTYLRVNQQLKLASVQALIRYGLVTSCCEGHNGRDSVRITRKGVLLLEEVRGEEIMA